MTCIDLGFARLGRRISVCRSSRLLSGRAALYLAGPAMLSYRRALGALLEVPSYLRIVTLHSSKDKPLEVKMVSVIHG